MNPINHQKDLTYDQHTNKYMKIAITLFIETVHKNHKVWKIKLNIAKQTTSMQISVHFPVERRSKVRGAAQGTGTGGLIS
jgi:hypothetical protein